MKNTATLGQIQKLLSLLEGVTSEQVQSAIESGLLSEIIRSGELTSIKEKHLREQFVNGWKIVMRLIRPEEIFITCPRNVCTYYDSNPDRKGKYQVKVWKGNYGFWKKSKGHVSDGGSMPDDAILLLEYYDTKNFSEKSSCPNIAGEQLCGALSRHIKCEEWYKETLEGEGDYGATVYLDIISVRKES
ncbi:MAG: hypothetical protein WCJ74_00125 [bacterium]